MRWKKTYVEDEKLKSTENRVSSELGSNHTITRLGRNVITRRDTLCSNATWQNMFVIFSITVMDRLHRLNRTCWESFWSLAGEVELIYKCVHHGGGFACKWSSEVTLSVAAFMRAKCKKKKNEGIKYLSRWNEFCFRQQMTCGSCSGLRFDSSASQERLQKIPSASCGRGSVCEESKHTVGGGRVYLFKSRGFHHLLSQLSCDWWAITSFKLLCQMYF